MREVELPDGRTLELTGNESPQQLAALKNKLRTQYFGYEAPQEAAQAPEQEVMQQGGQGQAGAAAQGLLRGATFGLGDKAQAGIAAAYSGMSPEMQGTSIADRYNMALQNIEQEREQGREQFPVTSFGSELAGGLASGVAAAGTAPARALGSLARRGGVVGKIGAGALAGESAQRVYEAGQSEAGEEAEILGRQGASLGGVLGGAVPAAGAVGRAILPKADEALKPIASLARKYNIPLSVDQITSGRGIKTAQKVSQDIPFSGQEAFRDKQMQAFNKALLKTIGLDADKFTRSNMDKAFLNIGRKFDSFGKGKTFNVGTLKDGINEIIEDAPSFATQDAQKALKFNADKVLANVAGGEIKGEALNQLRVQVNRAARKAKDADTVELLKDLENVIVETLAQGDDAAIREAKKQYKNLLVLEPLAAKAKGGDISPTQLSTRASRVFGRQFVRGKAGEIGELADIGRELLPELGGSDTQARQMLQNLTVGSIAGSYFLNPAIALGGGGIAAVNRGLQSGLNRNQAIINAMTKEARDEILKLPAPQAQKAIDSISLNLGLISGMAGN